MRLGTTCSNDDYSDSRDMPPPPVPTRTPPLFPSSDHAYLPPPISASSSSSSTSSSSSKPRLALEGQTSPSISFSKLSLLSPVVPNPNTPRPDSKSPPTPSTSNLSAVTVPSSKATGKSKARRPTLSPQLPAETDKPVNATKARAKAKEGAKDKDKRKGKEKPEKPEGSKKGARARPSTPSTEPDEHVLKPSLLRREDALKGKGKGKKSASQSQSPASAPKSLAPSVSPPPPPSTPVVIAPDLLPEPPDEGKPPKVDAREDLPPAPNADGHIQADPPVEAPQVDAMEIDEPQPPAPISDDVVPSVTRSSSILSASAYTSLPIPITSVIPIVSPAASVKPPLDPLPHSTTEHASASSLTPSITVTESDAALSLALLASVSASEVRVPPSSLGPPLTSQHDPMDVVEPIADNAPAEPASMPTPLPDVLLEAQPSTPEPAPVPPVASDPPAPSEPTAPAVSEPPAMPASEPPPALDSEPEPEPQHPKLPLAPPKVKMSLKDWRKKKQREEREKEVQERTAATASPMSTVSGLPEQEHDQEHGSGLAEREHEHEQEQAAADPGSWPQSESVGMPSPVVPSTSLSESMTSGLDGNKQDEAPAAVVEQNEPKVDGDGDICMDGTLQQEMEVTGRADSIAADVGPPGESLHADSQTSNSPAPERTSPAPLVTNGRDVSPDSEVRRSASPWYDTDRDRRPSEPAPVETIEAKVELLDSVVPNGLVAPAPETSPEPHPLSDPRVRRPSTPARTSPKMLHARPALAAQPSQEDGEIFSPPPPKPPPLAPRSHTPPTHPRSFYAGALSPNRRSPPSAARQPLHPARYARNAGLARGVPSAPRALRESGGYGSSLGLGYPAGGGGGQNAPYFAPRGPSADRERERERERAMPRDWGRERGDGDRSWIPGPSRGRGRGMWGR